MKSPLQELPDFTVGEKIICPVHFDDKYHSATVVEWEPWANEKQKSKFVRVLTDEGRKVSVLRREVVKTIPDVPMSP